MHGIAEDARAVLKVASYLRPYNPIPIHPVPPDDKQPLQLANPGQCCCAGRGWSQNVAYVDQHQEKHERPKAKYPSSVVGLGRAKIQHDANNEDQPFQQ